MTISLAFLAPSLVNCCLAGRLSQGIGVARLFDAPVAWARQPQTGARAGGSLIREFPGAKSRLCLVSPGHAIRH
jgi:hypothetical protein